MNRFLKRSLVVALALGLTPLALAQGEKPAKTPEKQPATPSSPKDAASIRIGDPYTLSTCAITGKKLGSMGDPIVKVYNGREVRFCCDKCPEKFEKDMDAKSAKLDEAIIKDQAPLYPMTTSVVSGQPLPEKPFEFVYGNRMVRVRDASERSTFLLSPSQYIGELDKAVIAAQGKDYPLKTCVKSKETLGGMGEPVDLVLGGRLIRMCCKDCKEDIEKEPATYIAMVDAARKAAKDQPKTAPAPKKPAGS